VKQVSADVNENKHLEVDLDPAPRAAPLTARKSAHSSSDDVSILADAAHAHEGQNQDKDFVVALRQRTPP